jgi:hypothetical protein
MIVERDDEKRTYWLVTGYTELCAYLSCGIKAVSCFIREKTDTFNQRVTLLNRMFSEPTNWINKHKVIFALIQDGKSVEFISRKLKVTESDLKKYLIDPTIPEPFVIEAKQNDASFINLNAVAKLDISWKLRNKLFGRVVLPGKRNPDKLTTDKLQKLKWLLQRDNFYQLDDDEQWELIVDKVINYKHFLLNTMEQEIEIKLGKVPI